MKTKRAPTRTIAKQTREGSKPSPSPQRAIALEIGIFGLAAVTALFLAFDQPGFRLLALLTVNLAGTCLLGAIRFRALWLHAPASNKSIVYQTLAGLMVGFTAMTCIGIWKIFGI